MKNHNHDLVHQLSEIADSLWRFDQYTETAKGCGHCTALWEKLKAAYAGFEKEVAAEVKRHIDENRFD